MMTTMMMMSVVVSIKTQHTPGAVAAACNQAVQVAPGRFARRAWRLRLERSAVAVLCGSRRLLILFGQPPALVPVQPHAERYHQQWISYDYRSRSVVVQLVYQWLAEKSRSSCGVSKLIIDLRLLSAARTFGAAPAP
jgi:hypothetical protein